MATAFPEDDPRQVDLLGESLEILDLDEDARTLVAEEEWLTIPPEDNSSCDAANFLTASSDANLGVRKKSLVAKLDDLKRTASPQSVPTFTTPNASFTSRSSRDSPLASYLRTAALCSTPKSSTSSNNNYELAGAGDASPAATSSPFDGRTFTRNRPSPTRYRLALDPELAEPSPPRAANLTFDLNSGGGGGVNTTFTASPQKRNATFEIEEPRLLPPGDLPLNATFDMNSLAPPGDKGDLDERLSVASDASSGQRRLNSVGDVQHVAKMQEESLRDVPSQQHSRRASAFSPGSEASSATGGSPMGYQSEEGSGASDLSAGQLLQQKRQRQQQQQQYSSQDSLPDSPYSSQSLDSQPLSHSDRIGRSMPNLNKRGLVPPPAASRHRLAPPGGAGRAATTAAGSSRVPSSSAARGASQPPPPRGARLPSAPAPTYGLSRQHASDPKLASRAQQRPAAAMQMQNRQRNEMYAQQPPAQIQNPTSGLPRPPGASRIARPLGSGIPRPGTRLPVFQQRTAPRGGGPGKPGNWRDECY